jgi:hypothetical protein
LGLTFLTPLAGILGLSALLPLFVYRERQRRAAAVRRALGLPGLSPSKRAPTVLALVLVPTLLGLAAAQPVLDRAETRRERTDAQALFVLDTSRSMLASTGREGATRLERARSAAISLQRSLPTIPVGLASFTERMLPYVFPTTDARVVAATLADSMGIERARPVPSFSFAQRATTLGALTAVPQANYFAPSASKRLLVVFTDGETNDVSPTLARAFERRPRIETIFVRFWEPDERVYVTGVAERGYTPDPTSDTKLSRVASLVDGQVFSERALDSVRNAAQRMLGSGQTRPRRSEGDRIALMPYVTLAVVVPLAFLLWRRNL